MITNMPPKWKWKHGEYVLSQINNNWKFLGKTPRICREYRPKTYGPDEIVFWGCVVLAVVVLCLGLLGQLHH